MPTGFYRARFRRRDPFNASGSGKPLNKTHRMPAVPAFKGKYGRRAPWLKGKNKPGRD